MKHYTDSNSISNYFLKRMKDDMELDTSKFTDSPILMEAFLEILQSNIDDLIENNSAMIIALTLSDMEMEEMEEKEEAEEESNEQTDKDLLEIFRQMEEE